MISDRAGTEARAAEAAARIAPGDGIVVHRRPLTVLATGPGDLGPMAEALTSLVDQLVADPEPSFAPVAAGLQQFVVDHQPAGVAAVLDQASDPIAFLFDQAAAIGDHATHRAEGRAGWTTVFVEGDHLSLTVGAGAENPVVPWTLLHAGTVTGTTAQVLLTGDGPAEAGEAEPTAAEPVEAATPPAGAEPAPIVETAPRPEPADSVWTDEPILSPTADDTPDRQPDAAPAPIDDAIGDVPADPIGETDAAPDPIGEAEVAADSIGGAEVAGGSDPTDESTDAPDVGRVDLDLTDAPEPAADLDLTDAPEPAADLDLTDAPEPAAIDLDLTETAPLPAGMSVAALESSEPLWSWPPPSGATGSPESEPTAAEPEETSPDDIVERPAVGGLAALLTENRQWPNRGPEPGVVDQAASAVPPGSPPGEPVGAPIAGPPPMPPTPLGPDATDPPVTDLAELPPPGALDHQASPISGPPPMPPPGPTDPLPDAAPPISGPPPMPPPPSEAEPGTPPMPPPPALDELPAPDAQPIAGPPPMPDGAVRPTGDGPDRSDRTEAT